MSRPKNKDEYRAKLAETFAHVLEEKGLEWQKEWREKRKAAEPPKPPRNPGRKCMRKPPLETRKRWNAMRITLSQGGNHTTGKNRKRSEPHKD